MPKKDQNLKQASQYDKIIKENLEITLPVIIRDLLGLDIATSEELPDDIQHTKERKPDSLKRVTDAVGEIYVLHLEFQTDDEPEMVYRMAEYSIMLMRRYKLPVKQYVIFLRDTKPAMPVFIAAENHKYNFSLICIAEANYKLFLKADDPEVKMLGILANFGKEDKYNAIKTIVDGIKSSAKGDFADNRYFRQLRIFAQLRNSLKQEFEKVMVTVSKFFKEENDFFYKRGETKGLEKGKKEEAIAIARELKKEGLAIDFIAKTTKLPIEEIEKL
jgi:predicted transposase/invertase (TIGR01784 family)